MPAGFRIKNDDGTFQITDEVPNYALHSITSEFGDTGFPGTAVYAFQPTVTTMSQHEPDTYNGRCFVFAPCNDIPYTRPTSGLIGDIRNASNELMFSVNLRPLVIVDLVDWTTSTQEEELVMTYPSGREYAVIVLVETISEYGDNSITGYDGESETYYHSSMTRNTIRFKVDGNVVTFKYEATEFDSWDSVTVFGIPIPALAYSGYTLGSNTLKMKALIIDVTEL